MTRIAIVGVAGRMGRTLVNAVEQQADRLHCAPSHLGESGILR